MEISLKESSFLESFDLLWSKNLDKYQKNKLNLFVLKVNSNEFDYDLLIEMLLDPVIDYSISRQVKEKYKNRPATLSKKAREKFVEYARNNGELGELLLFCFLETHLGAPKILTKLELKTSTSHYVNGADGVHFLKLPDGNYQLIFGESKTSVYKGYKQDKIEMRGDRAEMSDFPLYLNTVAGGLDCRDQTIGGFSFVVKIYAVPVIEIIG